MKINKKVLIPVFATAMGLSVIGGISGAVAWYQYNSKVSASFVGASVADTGVLQIGTKASANADIVWGRDVIQPEQVANLVPVTFGETTANGSLAGKLAYAYPEAGCGEGYAGHSWTDPSTNKQYNVDGWVQAEAGVHYAQFDVYLQAYQTDATDPSGYKLVERNVYLTDIVWETLTANKVADEALRVHISSSTANHLLSKNAHGVDNKLPVFGSLDLDKNGSADKYHSTVFNANLKAYGVDDEGAATHAVTENIIYGEKDKYQTTESSADVLASRNAQTGVISGQDEKILVKTSADPNEEVKLTITVWLEGWEALKTGVNDQNQDVKAVEWNPYFSAGCRVQVGLQFDTGIFRGDDLAQ